MSGRHKIFMNLFRQAASNTAQTDAPSYPRESPFLSLAFESLPQKKNPELILGEKEEENF